MTTEPLTSRKRYVTYAAQRGLARLTPRQERRLRSKANQADRPHARTGRLRRRFDARDQQQVKARAAGLVAAVRNRRRRKTAPTYSGHGVTAELKALSQRYAARETEYVVQHTGPNRAMRRHHVPKNTRQMVDPTTGVTTRRNPVEYTPASNVPYYNPDRALKHTGRR